MSCASRPPPPPAVGLKESMTGARWGEKIVFVGDSNTFRLSGHFPALEKAGILFKTAPGGTLNWLQSIEWEKGDFESRDVVILSMMGNDIHNKCTLPTPGASLAHETKRKAGLALVIKSLAAQYILEVNTLVSLGKEVVLILPYYRDTSKQGKDRNKGVICEPYDIFASEMRKEFGDNSMVIAIESLPDLFGPLDLSSDATWLVDGIHVNGAGNAAICKRVFNEVLKISWVDFSAPVTTHVAAPSGGRSLEQVLDEHSRNSRKDTSSNKSKNVGKKSNKRSHSTHSNSGSEQNPNTKKSRDEGSGSQVRCHRCEKLGHVKNNCTTTMPMCRKCNTWLHYEKNCPYTNGQCYNCGGKGHHPSVCPKK